MKDIEINGIKETIVERSDFPIEEKKTFLEMKLQQFWDMDHKGEARV